MSDDWAKKYVEVHNQAQLEKRQEEQNAQKRREYAEVGAREKFHQIRERVKQDIQTLRGAVAFQPLRWDEGEGKITVMYQVSPRVTLSVVLVAAVIKYEYLFSPRDEGAGDPDKSIPGTLRICADLDGRITVSENGRGKTFASDAEVSDFLMRPLLDHIISQ